MAPLHTPPRPPPGRPGHRAALLGALFLAAAGQAAAVSAAAPAAPVAPAAGRRAVCIRGACFDAEIALTEAERARGLMHRDALPRDGGMLFVFPEEGLHRFWMKNTLIPLDIVFIGADRRVVGIAHRAQPCRAEPCETFGPDTKSAYALEIGGGIAAEKSIAAGDLVEFREPRPVR